MRFLQAMTSLNSKSALHSAQRDIVVYSSTTQLGALNVEAQGGVFEIKTRPNDIGIQSRGVKIVGSPEKKSAASEFFEEKVVVKTGR